MDCCCDCTYPTDVETLSVYPDTTDVFAPLDPIEFVSPEQPATQLPDPAAPVTPAPSIPYVDPVTASITTDMYIDALNQQDVAMTNLLSPYSADFTARYDSTTNSTDWYRDGDLSPSTPY